MSRSYLFTCRPVNLSTCLPGFTGQEVNKLYQGIMGKPYLFTCRPVNLSFRAHRSRVKYRSARHYGMTRFDRLRGKYRSVGHYGYPVLVHRPVNLSTCLPGLTGQEVNILYHGFVGNAYLFTCRSVNLSTCLPGLTGREVYMLYQGIIIRPYLFTCRPANHD